MLLSLMSTEETGETRVRADCLNFDVCYTYKLKKKLLEALGLYFLWDFRSRYDSRLHKISSFNYKCTPTFSEIYHRRSMIPAL